MCGGLVGLTQQEIEKQGVKRIPSPRASEDV